MQEAPIHIRGLDHLPGNFLHASGVPCLNHKPDSHFQYHISGAIHKAADNCGGRCGESPCSHRLEWDCESSCLLHLHLFKLNNNWQLWQTNGRIIVYATRICLRPWISSAHRNLFCQLQLVAGDFLCSIRIAQMPQVPCHKWNRYFTFLEILAMTCSNSDVCFCIPGLSLPLDSKQCFFWSRAECRCLSTTFTPFPKNNCTAARFQKLVRMGNESNDGIGLVRANSLEWCWAIRFIVCQEPVLLLHKRANKFCLPNRND